MFAFPWALVAVVHPSPSCCQWLIQLTAALWGRTLGAHLAQQVWMCPFKAARRDRLAEGYSSLSFLKGGNSVIGFLLRSSHYFQAKAKLT